MVAGTGFTFGTSSDVSLSKSDLVSLGTLFVPELELMELYERHLTLVYQQASFVVQVSGDPLVLILFSLEKKIQ